MQQPCGQGTKQSSSGLLAADWQAKQEKQSLSFKTTINKETTLEFAAIRCYPLLRRRRFRRYPLLSVTQLARPPLSVASKETFASAPSGRPGTFWFRNSPNRGRRTHEHGLTRRRPIMFDDQTTEAAAPAAKDRCMWTAHPRQPAQTTSANATYYRHPPQVDPRSPQVDQPPRQPAQTTSATATHYHHPHQVDPRSLQVDQPRMPARTNHLSQPHVLPSATPGRPQVAPSRPAPSPAHTNHLSQRHVLPSHTPGRRQVAPSRPLVAPRRPQVDPDWTLGRPKSTPGRSRSTPTGTQASTHRSPLATHRSLVANNSRQLIDPLLFRLE